MIGHLINLKVRTPFFFSWNSFENSGSAACCLYANAGLYAGGAKQLGMLFHSVWEIKKVGWAPGQCGLTTVVFTKRAATGKDFTLPEGVNRITHWWKVCTAPVLPLRIPWDPSMLHFHLFQSATTQNVHFPFLQAWLLSEGMLINELRVRSSSTL